MNAFMVFSHYERRRVLTEQPDVANTALSRELGRRWNNLSAAEREPFVAEAERLKDLHNKEYPGYKYRPAKKRPRAARQNQSPKTSSEAGVLSPVSSTSVASAAIQQPKVVGVGSMSRFSISQGQRGVLKSINPNRLHHRFTINRKYLSKLSKQSVGGFVALSGGDGPLSAPTSASGGVNRYRRTTMPMANSCEHSEASVAEEVSWASLRLSQSVPTSPEIPAPHQTPPEAAAQTMPSNSCPNTPLAAAAAMAGAARHATPSPYSWSDSASLPDSSASLPDNNLVENISLPTNFLDHSSSLTSTLNLNNPTSLSSTTIISTPLSQRTSFTTKISLPSSSNISISSMNHNRPAPSSRSSDPTLPSTLSNPASLPTTSSSLPQSHPQPTSTEPSSSSSGLPDLSSMFSTSLDSDLRLDWTDDQLKDLNLNTEDLELVGDKWLNNDIFSGIL